MILLFVGLTLLAWPVSARSQAPETSLESGTVDAGRADTGGVDAGGLDGGVDAGVTDAGAGSLDAMEAGHEDAGLAAPAEPVSAEETSGAHGAAVVSTEPSTAQVIRTIVGLMLLLVLAWLGGLPQVRRLEERLGITQAVTSGLPFVGLGALMHAPGVDVLSESVLTSLTPLLYFGLGWIGFHTGFQFEGRAMDEVPRGTGTVVVLLTSFPFVLIALFAALVIVATGLGVRPESFADGDALVTLARDAVILGLAGALSAPLIDRSRSRQAGQLASAVAVLDDVFAVAALAILAAWLRPVTEGGWQLPGVGWLFVTLGMAVTLGLVVHFSLRAAESPGERTPLLLGSVALTAGLAGYAHIPPLVVCFLAGLVLRNLPGSDKVGLEAAFTRLERPVYLLFLIIVGALWRIEDARGWLLLAGFVMARVGGRWLGARAARGLPSASRPPALDETPDRELINAPMGQLAIAMVVTAQTLYESPAVRAMVTAVIGGSIVLEILARVAARRGGASRSPTDDDASGAPSTESAATESAAAESAEDAASPDARGASDGPSEPAPELPTPTEPEGGAPA